MKHDHFLRDSACVCHYFSYLALSTTEQHVDRIFSVRAIVTTSSGSLHVLCICADCWKTEICAP